MSLDALPLNKPFTTRTTSLRGGQVPIMTDNSDTQSDLSPCSSFETLDSLKIKGGNIDLSYEECHKEDGHEEDGLTLVQIALDVTQLSLFC